MANNVPQHFNSAFLHWFEERTEATWQNYQTRTFESLVAARVGGSDWQRGTRWLGGLDEQEIVRIEQRSQVRFPPDYRLFLQMLHSVDRPMVAAEFARDTTMVPRTTPSFYNWQTDTTSIQAAYEWLVQGLVFAIQWNKPMATKLGCKTQHVRGTRGPSAGSCHYCTQTDPRF